MAAPRGAPPPPPPRPREVELTALSVGMWSSRSHSSLSLLLLPASLVLLADRTAAVRASTSAAVLSQLGAKSPFHSTFYKGGCVCAFEVPLAAICGLDYTNPLCQPGRVVVEARGMRKREFKTLESARAYYLGSAALGDGAPMTPGSTFCGTPRAPAAAAAAPAQVARPSRSMDAARPLRGMATAAAVAEREGTAAVPAPADEPGPWRPQPGSPEATRRGRGAARQTLLGRLESSCSSLEAPGCSRSSSEDLLFRTSLDEDRPALAAAGAGAAAAAVLAAPRQTVPLAAAPSAPAVASPIAAAASPSNAGPPAAVAVAVPPTAAAAPAAAGAAAGLRWEAGRASAALQPRLETIPSGVCPAEWDAPLARCNGAACAGACSGEWPCGGGQPLHSQLQTPLHVGSAPTPGGFLNSPRSRSRSVSRIGEAGGGSGSGKLGGGGAGMRNAHSTGDLQQASTQQEGQRRPAALGPQPSWPLPCVWTSTTQVYEYRTIIFQFSHTAPLPQLLQPVVQGDERLLKMYESGLPTWAIYMPLYGLYYRPWLRTLTWLLYYAFSIFSLACGFYDLYKNLPGLQLLLQRLMASMWLPPGSILLWLETHTQFRLSILLTYLFGKSEVFVHVVRWSGNVARGLRVMLQPATDTLGPPLAALGQAVQLLGVQAWQGVASMWLAVGSLLYAVLAPLMHLVVDLWAGLAAAMAPVLLVVYSIVVGPVAWLVAAWRHLCAAGGVVWVGLVEAGRGVSAGAGALKATVSAGKAVRSAAPDVASQVSWLYVLPAETYELLHNSALKVMRGLQTVAKFLLQMGTNVARHQLSLRLVLGRVWRRGRERLRAWLEPPRRVLATLLSPFVHLIQMLLWLAVSDSEREAASRRQQQQGEEQEESQAGPPEAGAASNRWSMDNGDTAAATAWAGPLASSGGLSAAAASGGELRRRHGQERGWDGAVAAEASDVLFGY